MLSQIPKDVQAYATILQQCCRAKDLKKLHQYHALTIKLRIAYDDFIRAKLVSAYASCSQISDAHFIFDRCNRQSTFLYNTLIRGYASIKQFDISLDVFRRMMFCRKEIDSNTLPAVLKSVGAVSGLRVGKRVHGYALARGFGSDLAHCNVLISMYAKCGDMGYARKVFDEMSERNLMTWSAMMSGYGMHGEFDEVFELFDRLLALGVGLDGVVFTTVLTACSHGGRVEAGKAYFRMMTDVFKLSPSMEHYTCMVDMLGRSGRIGEAKAIIEKMEIEPDEALWRALLGACKFHRQPEISVRGRVYDFTDD